jgi:hypothetical protein
VPQTNNAEQWKGQTVVWTSVYVRLKAKRTPDGEFTDEQENEAQNAMLTLRDELAAIKARTGIELDWDADFEISERECELLDAMEAEGPDEEKGHGV